MANKQTAVAVEPIVVELPIRDAKVGSVRFLTSDKNQPIGSLYIAKTAPGINEAKAVKVTVEIIG